MNEKDLKRFWGKVDKKIGRPCWIYHRAHKRNGYGYFTIMSKKYRAHRFSYMLAKGAIPRNLVLDHLCRNKLCVNPKHLEAVSYRENVLRGIGTAAVNARKKECLRGHKFSKKNTYLWRGHRTCRECHRITQAKLVRKNVNK